MFITISDAPLQIFIGIKINCFTLTPRDICKEKLTTESKKIEWMENTPGFSSVLFKKVSSHLENKLLLPLSWQNKSSLALTTYFLPLFLHRGDSRRQSSHLPLLSSSVRCKACLCYIRFPRADWTRSWQLLLESLFTPREHFQGSKKGVVVGGKKETNTLFRSRGDNEHERVENGWWMI